MRCRQYPTLPKIWLMTDERMGDALLPSIAALPRGSGVIFRHYHIPDRRHLFDAVRVLAKARRLMLILGGSQQLAQQWRADGAHGRSRQRAAMVMTAPVHSIRERLAAEQSGAALLFVSPLFATQSHPGARPLGRVRFGMSVQGAKVPVIALGGMTRARAQSLRRFGIYGWAAIDGLTRQKRNAVPT